MKNLLDKFKFKSKAGQENIFQPKIGNYSLHPESNENGIRLANFAAYSKENKIYTL